MQGEGELSQPKLSSLIGHFVGHVCLGIVGFVALAIPSILLSLAAHYLEQVAVSVLVIDTLLGIHYFLLIVATVTFAAYMLVSIYDAARELIRYAKDL